eukprot:scaffold18513_cov101-Isochrysis_galbana.AAC.4
MGCGCDAAPQPRRRRHGEGRRRCPAERRRVQPLRCPDRQHCPGVRRRALAPGGQAVDRDVRKMNLLAGRGDIERIVRLRRGCPPSRLKRTGDPSSWPARPATQTVQVTVTKQYSIPTVHPQYTRSTTTVQARNTHTTRCHDPGHKGKGEDMRSGQRREGRDGRGHCGSMRGARERPCSSSANVTAHSARGIEVRG